MLTIADDAFRKSRRHKTGSPSCCGQPEPPTNAARGQTEATNKSLNRKKRPARTSGPGRKALLSLTQRESPNNRKPGSRIATIRPPRNSAPATPMSSAHHTTQCAIATRGLPRFGFTARGANTFSGRISSCHQNRPRCSRALDADSRVLLLTLLPNTELVRCRLDLPAAVRLRAASSGPFPQRFRPRDASLFRVCASLDP